MSKTTISISQETRDELFQLKESPDETYETVIRDLMADKQAV